MDSQDWEALVERARKQVLEVMEQRLGIEGLRGMITWEEVNTPLSCQYLFFVYQNFKLRLGISFKETGRRRGLDFPQSKLGYMLNDTIME